MQSRESGGQGALYEIATMTIILEGNSRVCFNSQKANNGVESAVVREVRAEWLRAKWLNIVTDMTRAGIKEPFAAIDLRRDPRRPGR